MRKKSNSIKMSLQVALLLGASLVLGPNCSPALADDDVSLDSMWSDQTGATPGTGSPASANSPPNPSSTPLEGELPDRSSERSDRSTRPNKKAQRPSDRVEKPSSQASTERRPSEASSDRTAPTTNQPSSSAGSPTNQEGGLSRSVWDTLRLNKSNLKAPGQETAQAGAPGTTGTSAPRSMSATAPMITVEAFKQTSFIQTGNWPGLGPFKATLKNANELSDPSENKLRLKVDQQKITEAELQLVKQPSVSNNFLNVQMTTDFLLEALGVKPKKISEFNSQLEKEKQSVAAGAIDPVSLSAGRYLVSFVSPSQAAISEDDRDRLALVIRVNSKDASEEAIREHSIGTGEPATPIATATGAAASVRPAASQPPRAVPPRTGIGAIINPQPSDPLKQTFIDVIKSWQSIKKVAVRQRQTTELSNVLAGKALTRQSEAINWLQQNHKYYEMNPRGVVVSKYTELTPGRKFAVNAQVKEQSRFIDDSNGQVVKEGEDTYNVNYTIEKIGDKWFISDSAIIPGVAKPPGKPSR